MWAPGGVEALGKLCGGVVVGRMATPAFSMASSRRSRTRWVNVHSSTSESAFVGHDTMHRGPPGTFAHRSHATTDA